MGMSLQEAEDRIAELENRCNTVYPEAAIDVEAVKQKEDGNEYTIVLRYPDRTVTLHGVDSINVDFNFPRSFHPAQHWY